MKSKPFNSTTVKLIAIVCMLIDHTGAAMIEPWVMYGVLPRSPWLTLDLVIRAIGRIAFPIFCFTLVEGFEHTRNKAKYLGRLLLFSLISEVPFDLAFERKVLEFGHQNVFFTLALGLMAMIVIRWGEEHLSNQILQIAFSIIITVSFAALGEVLVTDYSASGVLAILSIYFLRKIPVLSMFMPIVVLVLLCGWMEAPAILAVPILLGYNHQRGKGMKYFFYAFYPVHLFLLYILQYFIFIR